MKASSGRKPLIGKFCRARSVWTPYSALVGTSRFPSGSFSRRVSGIVFSVIIDGFMIGRSAGRVGGRRATGNDDGHDRREHRQTEACDAEPVEASERDSLSIIHGQFLDRASDLLAQTSDARSNAELR